MMYIRSNLKALAGLLTAAALFVACNSNHSPGKVVDTSTATSVDTSPMTGAEEPSASEQPSAPVTNSSSDNTKTTPATSPSVNTAKTKEVVVNKKVQVVVEAVPVVNYSKVKMDKAGVYEYPEVAPQYPGGNYAIQNYINNHITYPRLRPNNNIEGRTNVSFIVNENGRVTNAHITGKKLGYGLDEEAVKIVSSMPYWKPATVKGKPVKSKITLPIVFKVEV